MIKLRKVQASDLDALYEVTRDKETMKYVGNRVPWSRERTQKFVTWGEDHPDDLTYAIMEYGDEAEVRKYVPPSKRKDETLVGIVQLSEYSYMDCFLKGKLVITIFIRGDRQGRGYGKRAIVELLKMHPDKEIYASIDTKNTRSRVLFEKLGFTKVGTLHYKEGTSDVYMAPSESVSVSSPPIHPV